MPLVFPTAECCGGKEESAAALLLCKCCHWTAVPADAFAGVHATSHLHLNSCEGQVRGENKLCLFAVQVSSG